MAYNGEEMPMKEMDDKTYLRVLADALDSAERIQKYSLEHIENRNAEYDRVVEMTSELATLTASKLREIAEKL
ncbi:hypothetical protein A7311_01105 [Paenibacillus polymyxa]|uniref:hypothetical protein n=1 Tax=Paenibacillus polymyxa TaxID=1406 RepID=UPI00083DBC53|nr:hypothetical protein [Paenibacillus polymyxa]ODB56954.1 hypothetical protein A7311_01105 [Paenibacillus polymyxa]